MSFKKNNYVVIKQAISKEMTFFLFDYISLKRRVVKDLYNAYYTVPDLFILGHWNDTQVPNTYCHYSDIAFETLLKKLKPLVEKHTSLKLYMNYSYFRFYKTNDVLKKHKDRPACEISTTLNLGGDQWPIYLGNKKIILNAGDMVIYKGNIVEHWREKFTGKECAQVFLHYSNKKTKGTKERMYDRRKYIGYPPYDAEGKFKAIFDN
jgi:hypothetical protein|tara:strand:+ start:34 stop:654 length:621 start_codon:yes stop_codon:yes gene_type:complete